MSTEVTAIFPLLSIQVKGPLPNPSDRRRWHFENNQMYKKASAYEFGITYDSRW